MDVVKAIVFVIAIAYFASAILLFVFQRKLMYYPAPEYEHDLQVKEIENEGERLKVIATNTNNQHAVVYFGGNAEAVIHSAHDFLQLLPDHAFYFVNYRGYGGSTGTPTEDGFYSDSLAVYDQVRAMHDSVSVVGRSLGSGVATFLASKRDIRAMVLVTPFDSIQRVAESHFPFYPMSALLKDKYDSLSRVGIIEAPVLIVRAEHDEVISADHSISLFNAFPEEQVSMQVIKNAGHNSLSASREYYSVIKNFLK